MTVALYEFPLCEKVRNYLRLEQLFQQLKEARHAKTAHQHLYFFKTLFDLIELIERLDLRTDFVRDIDSQERNLVHWSQHPDIDKDALDRALKSLHKLLGEIKQINKLGSGIKEERFLSNIRQRFAIPGGVTSFDLPSLFCWIRQPQENKDQEIDRWISHLNLVEESVTLIMTFLRERGRFETVIGKNGFYQGNVADKAELIRVQCDNTQGYYPVLSGNTYRYGIKFMRLHPEAGTTGAVANNISFELARC
ncbi:cell division protein ZapD [Glaciecola sp. 1036]|uniref:cell division protein ZapD n=1 Tax=Alteromonadaceae TaxID=72275 RepID=UPI003D014B53